MILVSRSALTVGSERRARHPPCSRTCPPLRGIVNAKYGYFVRMAWESLVFETSPSRDIDVVVEQLSTVIRLKARAMQWRASGMEVDDAAMSFVDAEVRLTFHFDLRMRIGRKNLHFVTVRTKDIVTAVSERRACMQRLSETRDIETLKKNATLRRELAKSMLEEIRGRSQVEHRRLVRAHAQAEYSSRGKQQRQTPTVSNAYCTLRGVAPRFRLRWKQSPTMQRNRRRICIL